ncbi:hypothetical protein FMEAI12_4020038 [Parafrankia sp. Ea1.12]|nr:hypothetical protein FMEAI12_4020038 [Parafrankia sp. Ea1.12]
MVVGVMDTPGGAAPPVSSPGGEDLAFADGAGLRQAQCRGARRGLLHAGNLAGTMCRHDRTRSPDHRRLFRHWRCDRTPGRGYGLVARAGRPVPLRVARSRRGPRRPSQGRGGAL